MGISQNYLYILLNNHPPKLAPRFPVHERLMAAHVWNIIGVIWGIPGVETFARMKMLTAEPG